MSKRDASSALALTPERKALRATRIGASEVGALFGLDPFCTRFELWHRKAGSLPEEDLSDNRHVFWGTILEPAVAQGVALREGWAVRKVNRDSPHPEVDCLGASLDYEVVGHERGPGVLEIKTADAYAVRSWDNGEPPLRYQLQLQAQLDCTRRAWGAIAVLVGGNDLRVYTYEPHGAAIERIRTEAVKFWQTLHAGLEPPIDYQADAAVIAKLYSHTTADKVVDMRGSDRFAQLCRAYKLAGRVLSHVEARKDAIKAELVTMAQDAALALGEGCKLTARDVEPKEISYTRSGYRDVRITVDKEKKA